ncbi:hypothetical protein SE17_31710 [Kouleothrix aurantiaca]|uniref:Uncharacterized protein n=1 Tax=Kouleothrix aurantiaca TaxID=186479 RepID=A0A0P9DAJ2_9CHLR|nr:hypothetical protein SE17_31710 [Kouleothrix aurantiaca]
MALVVLCCVAGVLLVPERGQRFAVPGAYNVLVTRQQPGVRVISFEVLPGAPDWAYILDRSLRAQGWLPPDYSGANGQFNRYSYVMSLKVVTVWEEAEIDGDVQKARITLRRWLRIAWLTSPIYF